MNPSRACRHTEPIPERSRLFAMVCLAPSALDHSLVAAESPYVTVADADDSLGLNQLRRKKCVDG